jgi:hypothetical protein
MSDQSGGTEITEDHLAVFEADVRGLYLDAVKAMFTPPQLANTDNDPLLPQTVYFDIESSESAF